MRTTSEPGRRGPPDPGRTTARRAGRARVGPVGRRIRPSDARSLRSRGQVTWVRSCATKEHPSGGGRPGQRPQPGAGRWPTAPASTDHPAASAPIGCGSSAGRERKARRQDHHDAQAQREREVKPGVEPGKIRRLASSIRRLHRQARRDAHPRHRVPAAALDADQPHTQPAADEEHRQRPSVTRAMEMKCRPTRADARGPSKRAKAAWVTGAAASSTAADTPGSHVGLAGGRRERAAERAACRPTRSTPPAAPRLPPSTRSTATDPPVSTEPSSATAASVTPTAAPPIHPATSARPGWPAAGDPTFMNSAGSRLPATARRSVEQTAGCRGRSRAGRPR